MKRLLLVMLTVCLLLASSAVWAGLKEDIESDEFVFRRVKWGMTIDEVKQSENDSADIGEGTILSEEDSWEDTVVLYYASDRLYGSPKTEIYYQFWLEPGAPPPASYPPPLSDVQLKGIFISITIPAMGESDPATAYEKIEKTLTVKYGPLRKYTDQDGPPELTEGNQHYILTQPDLEVNLVLDFNLVIGPRIILSLHSVSTLAE